MDADQPVVLSPSLGRRWWILVVTMALIYITTMVVVASRHHRWQFLPLIGAAAVVAGFPLWWMRRRMRVTLANGMLTRPMGRVRIPASDIIDVTTGLGPMGRRAVYVTTRTGNLVPVGLEGPRPHHAVVAMGTIREWAERHGGGSLDAMHESLPPLADGTVLTVSRVPVTVWVAALMASWMALAARSFSLRPPWWVLVCGVVGAVLAICIAVQVWRMHTRIEGDTLVVRQRSRTVRVAAADIAGFDVGPDQFVRALRTGDAPVVLSIRNGSVPGVVARLTTWARMHGGATGAAAGVVPRFGWARWAMATATMALAFTPLFWVLWPHDVGRGYFLVAVTLGSNVLLTRLQSQGSRR